MKIGAAACFRCQPLAADDNTAAPHLIRAQEAVGLGINKLEPYIMDKSVFRPPRRAAVAEGRKRRARKPRAAPAPRAPTARQRAAVLGQDFEDEGV